MKHQISWDPTYAAHTFVETKVRLEVSTCFGEGPYSKYFSFADYAVTVTQLCHSHVKATTHDV